MAEIAVSLNLDPDNLVNGLSTKDTVALASACLQQLGETEQLNAINDGLNDDERFSLAGRLVQPLPNDQQIQVIRSALTDTELRGLYEAIRGEFED